MLVLWVSGSGLSESILEILLAGPDDMFLREDLAQGKYKIDFEAAKEFDTYYFDNEDHIYEMDPVVKSKVEL